MSYHRDCFLLLKFILVGLKYSINNIVEGFLFVRISLLDIFARQRRENEKFEIY